MYVSSCINRTTARKRNLYAADEGEWYEYTRSIDAVWNIRRYFSFAGARHIKCSICRLNSNMRDIKGYEIS